MSANEGHWTAFCNHRHVVSSCESDEACNQHQQDRSRHCTDDSPRRKNLLETSCCSISIADCIEDFCCSCASVYYFILGESQFSLFDSSIDFENSIMTFILVGS